MNYIKGILLFIFIHFVNVSIAQLTVSPNRATALYDVGEIAYYNVSSSSGGTATYSIRYDDKAALVDQGTIDLAAGGTVKIPFEATEPGFYIFSVTQGSSFAQTSIGFSPYSIMPLEPGPADFDAFWSAAIAERFSNPINPQVIFDSSVVGGTIYRINIANINNRRMYGYISIPNGTGPFPAVITLPPAGTDVGIAIKETFLMEQGKMISLSLNIHNAEPDAIDPNAYLPNELIDRDNYYYKHAVVGIMRFIDYLFTRNDFDGENLILTGNSQGGGLSLMVAGLDDRVKAIAISNPAMCQHTGLVHQKASSYPFYAHASRALNTDFSISQAAVNASKYYDAIYFAQRYKGPCLTTVSYDDMICPAATVFAAYNQIRGPKVLVHSQNYGHNAPNEYWGGRIDFFRRHIGNIETNPWNSLGYSVDAGPDKTTTVNVPVTLNGSKDLNNQNFNSDIMLWEKVEGPGKVSISNPNALTTRVSFDAPGTYVLRLYTNDNQFLSTLNRRITVEDVVTITVN